MSEYTLLFGDNREILRTFPKNSIGSIITDPPYNTVNRKTGGLRKIDKGEADSELVNIPFMANQFARIAEDSIYVFCSDDQFSEWVLAFKGMGLTTRICVWQKTNPSPMNGKKLWLSGVELCVYARKPKAPFSLSCKTPVWVGKTERYANFPCPKPVWLMQEIIRASVPEGRAVLDPYLGSGSTGVGCMLEGREFIGIEQNSEYYEIAKQRLSQFDEVENVA